MFLKRATQFMDCPVLCNAPLMYILLRFSYR